FLPTRACIFDVDGLLIHSEDIYTEIYNNISHEYRKQQLPWQVNAAQQSRGTTGMSVLFLNGQIDTPLAEWKAKEEAQQHLFSNCAALPGALDVLNTLSHDAKPPIKTALASSAGRKLFDIKTSHIPGVSSSCAESCRVFGDDPDMSDSHKKPCPDLFLLALDCINKMCKEPSEQPVQPEECLVFEDSIAGVEAGRRASRVGSSMPGQGRGHLERKFKGRKLS
ncbi:HAD-like protein, partial [Tothia fuscella]